MTKFLGYSLLFMILVGGCVGAFDDTSYTPDTTVTTYAPDTTDIPMRDPQAPDVSTNNSVAGSGIGSLGGSDIDCDNAEELYDSGEMTDDIADYCDYGPDGEWDTEDDYDSWEE